MHFIFQHIKILVFLAVFSLFSVEGIAQSGTSAPQRGPNGAKKSNGKSIIKAPPAPPAAEGGTTAPPCWPPPCVPIDGGIGWLIAAGVAYGAKKSFLIKGKRGKV